MNINIYYGGRGLIDDPTMYVLTKVQEVLEELNVNVTRYNLNELKNTITTLPQTLKEADGIILATTVEWLGIGGYMQMFLDSCWLYGDKNVISEIYMFPIVMSKTYGEKEASLTLVSSWDMLGGKSVNGLNAYVDDTSEFEFNSEYASIIEKYTENMYRTISQKINSLPSSCNTIKQTIMKETIKLTPQENERLSKFAADDKFAEKQKKDIEELSSMFKEMLNEKNQGGDDYYLHSFIDAFNEHNGQNIKATYMFMISDKDKSILVSVNNDTLNVEFGENASADVIGKMTKEVFDSIVKGRMTFQRAFMTGAMAVKGNYKTLCVLNELFVFE